MADVQELLSRAAELDKIAKDLEAPLDKRVTDFATKQREALDKFREKQETERAKFNETVRAEESKANEARREALKATQDAARAMGGGAAPSRRSTGSSSGGGTRTRTRTRMTKADVEKLEAEIVKAVKSLNGKAKRGDIANGISFDVSKASLSQRLDAMTSDGGPLKKDTSKGRANTTYSVA